MLSNDSNVGTKVILFHLYAYLLVGIVLGGFILAGKISVWSLTLLPVLIPLFYLSFSRKKKIVAVNVFTSGEDLCYDLDRKSHAVSKILIKEIYDSGFFSGAQEIVVKFKDGREITFFPSKDYGTYYKGRVLKELNHWLTRSSENLMLKKGMPKLK